MKIPLAIALFSTTSTLALCCPIQPHQDIQTQTNQRIFLTPSRTIASSLRHSSLAEPNLRNAANLVDVLLDAVSEGGLHPQKTTSSFEEDTELWLGSFKQEEKEVITERGQGDEGVKQDGDTEEKKKKKEKDLWKWNLIMLDIEF
ncbi:uncharacterized protein VTP21DRAFT_4577 [Calcarisporiella thermophila]|uniref:uncharacterized protein n=1 Tax=Calcarisporiella thermophila TaxID=911321 RepID=UPI003743BDCE